MWVREAGLEWRQNGRRGERSVVLELLDKEERHCNHHYHWQYHEKDGGGRLRGGGKAARGPVLSGGRCHMTLPSSVSQWVSEWVVVSNLRHLSLYTLDFGHRIMDQRSCHVNMSTCQLFSLRILVLGACFVSARNRIENKIIVFKLKFLMAMWLFFNGFDNSTAIVIRLFITKLFQETSLHGFQYLPGRGLFSTVLWLFC